jgi:transposase
MKPYSNDLRRRIVEAYESGEHSLDDVATFFSVSKATMKNFARRNRLTGSADALPHAGGKKPNSGPSINPPVCSIKFSSGFTPVTQGLFI